MKYFDWPITIIFWEPWKLLKLVFIGIWNAFLLACLYRQENENFLGKTYGMKMWWCEEHFREHIGNKRNLQKKSKEEGGGDTRR
jgi:hypothetical protein